MSATRLIPALAVASALVLPAAANADEPVSTNAPSTVCTATVTIGEGSFRHGDYQVTTPEQTIRLADHTGALGEQDPCAA